MKRLNNKGFAITTIVYGLAIMSTMILTLVMSLLATTRRDNNNLATEVEAELNRFSKTSVIFNSASAAGQEYIIPEGQAGWYRIELWGAQGGGDNGGLGAYTSGVIKLEEGDVLYFVIGKQGATGKGGGATDVRIEHTDSVSSIETRIMVAAGGGSEPGAAGGTLVGYNSNMLAPGAKLLVDSNYSIAANTTLLGYEIVSGVTNFGTSTVTQTGTPGGHPNADNAGGEGYFTSTNGNYGGVSFISGYIGSKAYVKGYLQTHPLYTYYKKNGATYETDGRDYYFVDGIMLPGVKIGDGQAKIERVASSDTVTELPRQNEKLNNISAIRDCVGNSSVNTTITSISAISAGSIVGGSLSGASTVGSSTCKTFTFSGGAQNVDEIAVFHAAGYDYQNHTIEVLQNGTWVKAKGNGSGYTVTETETVTGIRISAYQPDYTTTIPETGNYYIVPVTAEGKVISGHSEIDDRANPLTIQSLEGAVRQKWSIEKLNPKLEKAGVTEYKIVELVRYNALTIYKDENMEGNQLIVSSFNNLARNEPAIWQVKPMGDGTVTITSSAPTFTSSKNTGNIYVQTNPSEVDEYNMILIGINTNATQRFKLIKLDY